MAVIDGRTPTSPQTLHLSHLLPGVVHLDPLRIQPNLHPLADQAGGHRVDILRRPQRREHADPHALPPEVVQTRQRQIMHPLQLLAQLARTTAIAAGQNLAEKGLVLGPRRKIPAPPQQQGLLDRALEAVMRLLDVAILVAPARGITIGLNPVMRQRSKVAVVEGAGSVTQLVSGRREVVRPMQLRRFAQLPDGRLEAANQSLEALRKADPPRFPIRVGQDEVVEKVVEALADEADPQLIHACEVALARLSRAMLLGEHHLSLRTLRGPPTTDPSLQRAQLAV